MNRTTTLWVILLIIGCQSVGQTLSSLASHTSNIRIPSLGIVQNARGQVKILCTPYGFSSGFKDWQINYAVSNYDVIDMQWFDYPSVKNSILKLKQQKPDLVILVYISAPSASPAITTYINWTEVNTHEEWFLHDIDGNRLQIEWDSGWYCMDIANLEWRKYLGDWCYETLYVKCPQIDGIFVDNAWGQFSRNVWTVPREKIPKEYDYPWHADMKGLLQYLKTRIGNKLLIPNTQDNTDYIDVSDGKMAEGFVHYPWWDVNYFDETFNYPEKMAKFKSVIDRGKYFLALDGSSNIQSSEDAKRVFYYSFCSFLLLTEEKASFMFTTWDDFKDPYGLLPLANDAELLGPAIGDYYALTYSLARDFEDGRVIVNYTPYNATINLGGNFKTLDGDVLNQITLPPHTGVMLYEI